MEFANEVSRKWYRRGATRLRAGDWRGAAAAFKEVLRHEPDTVAARYRFGIAHQYLANWQDAVSAFEIAVAADDGKSHGYYQLDWRHRLAFAYRMLGRLAEARAVYTQGAPLDPALIDWTNAMGDSKPEVQIASLWHLIDRQPLPATEHEALAVIEGARPKWVQLPDKWWFAAYCEMYRRGWPRAAYAAKAVASHVVRHCSANPSQQSLGQQIASAQAFADIGDYARARRHAKAALDDVTEERLREVVDLNAGLGLLDGDFSAADAAWNSSTNTPEDVAFGELVKGRSVAVVAAGDTGLNNGQEIDAFDIVVRTNFRGRDILDAHARQIGRRVDICYFNGNFEPEHRQTIIESLKQDPIKFVVLRFDDDSSEAYQPIVPVRTTHLLNPFYRMNTYAIPKIAFDLIRFRPARIKIFNADFFLGRNSHYAGYIDYNIDLIRSLRGHDVIRNIRMMREWLRQGLVDGDSTFIEVLSASDETLYDRVTAKVQEAIRCASKTGGKSRN